MRNIEVISRFIDGYDTGKGSNLYIEIDNKNRVLMNYATPIAIWILGLGIVLNKEKYSAATSRNQTYLINGVTEYNETTEKGIRDLIRYGETKEELVYVDKKVE